MDLVSPLLFAGEFSDHFDLTKSVDDDESANICSRRRVHTAHPCAWVRGELLLTTIYVVDYDKYHLNSTDQKKKIFCMTEKCAI